LSPNQEVVEKTKVRWGVEEIYPTLVNYDIIERRKRESLVRGTSATPFRCGKDRTKTAVPLTSQNDEGAEFKSEVHRGGRPGNSSQLSKEVEKVARWKVELLRRSGKVLVVRGEVFVHEVSRETSP